MLKIQVYDKSQRPEWDSFVRTSKNGTFLLYRDYMDYHQDRFEDLSLMVEDDKGRLVALLPASRDGDRLVSHGGLTYGGFITDENMKTPLMLEVFEHTLEFLRDHGFTAFVYKSIPHIYHAAPAEEDLYALHTFGARVERRVVISVVDARNPLKFQERRRRGIRRARQNGLEVAQSHDFAAYWAILTENLSTVHDAAPVHTLDEIQRLAQRLPEHIKLYACYDGDLMLAGVVIYETERVARAQYISSSQVGKDSGALDLLFDVLLNTIYADKPYFEFGGSQTPGSYALNLGLIEQKEGFGARTVIHDHYRIDLV